MNRKVLLGSITNENSTKDFVRNPGGCGEGVWLRAARGHTVNERVGGVIVVRHPHDYGFRREGGIAPASAV